MVNTLSELNITDRLDEITKEWKKAKPFHFVVIDDFLKKECAERILSDYPTPDSAVWEHIPYVHQRKKLTLQSNFPGAINEFFRITETEDFVNLISKITDIPKLTSDPELVGGGLHQIMDGGYLDVHIDYNFHPTTKMHRRLNLILYLNRDWKREYEGYLELWDMSEKKQIAHIEPIFNRAVIFETNEVSYHGHPKPLKVPSGVTRKSLAIYYYTQEREQNEVAAEHNTVYKQTTGVNGYVKTSASAIISLTERGSSKGGKYIIKDLFNRAYRKLKGLPPENK